jgi:oligo-1,6-glucosidase
MQWNDAPQAGFSSGEPWIKVNLNYKEINVEAALNDPDSVYFYYKKLIALRKENDVMVYGDYKDLLPDDEHLYVYSRSYKDETWLIVLNHCDGEQAVTLDGFTNRKLILSNYQRDLEKDEEILFPHEARIYQITK